MTPLHLHRHMMWIAVAWVVVDCLLAWSWQWTVPREHAKAWQAFMLPALLVACWQLYAWWDGRSRRDHIGLLIATAALGALSVAAVDFDTWLVPERPTGVWNALGVLTAMAFGFAAWSVEAWSRPRRVARIALLYGLVYGMVAPYQEVVCGPSLTMTEACKSMTGGGVPTILMSIALATFAILILGAFRSRP